MNSALYRHLKVLVWTFFVSTFVVGQVADAKVRSVTLTTDTELEAPRWLYDSKAKVQKSGLPQSLYQIRKAQLDGQFNQCIKLTRGTWKVAQSFQPWLLNSWLECAQSQYNNDKKIGHLNAPLKLATAHADWLVHGSAALALRSQVIEASLLQLEAQLKGQRAQAWVTINRLQDMSGWLSSAQKARLFQFAGELAFLQQNLLAAQNFILRSLSFKESRELRRKLESIRSALLRDGKGVPVTPSSESLAEAKSDDVEASEGEMKLYERIKTAMGSGDQLSAVEDGVKLIEEYPGGRRANWAAERIEDIYLNLAYKRDKKYDLLREKVLKQMKKADASRLYHWASKAASRNFFDDCQQLGEQALETMGPHPDTTEILRLTSRCALFSGQYDKAKRHFQKLAREHAGSKESVEAVFRLGLLHYRLKEYSQAASYFEKLQVLPNGDDFGLRGLYWHWRTQQKAGSEEADKLAERLIAEYPLTYYGLRARAETNKGQLHWKSKKEEAEPLTAEMWLTDAESLAWERAQIFLKAGWFKEAQAELAVLPDPQTPTDKIVRANIWATAFDHYKATRLVVEAWNEDPSLVQWRFVKMIYPLDFDVYVKNEAKERELDASLIRSVIRQESSFRPVAKSHASAMGLMQLIPLTAREVARFLRYKNLNIPEDLYDPKTNVKFGSYYLWRMIRAFDGHVPLALAAYNAGIGNIRRWMGAREDLASLQSQQDLEPDSEIWIDELAWNETSYYVKAILRNMMIYQLMAQGEVTLDKPVWK